MFLKVSDGYENCEVGEGAVKWRIKIQVEFSGKWQLFQTVRGGERLALLTVYRRARAHKISSRALGCTGKTVKVRHLRYISNKISG